MRRSAVLAGFVVAVLAVLAAGQVLAQGARDGATGEKSDAQCYGHHREEGFRSMDLFPEPVQEVVAGQPFEFHLTVRNPWLHELRDVRGFVNTSRAPGVTFPGAKEPAAFDQTGSLPLDASAPSSQTFPLAVDANATLLVARLEGGDGSIPTDFDLLVHSPGGVVYSAPGDEFTSWRPSRPFQPESVRVPYDNLSQEAPGEWRVQVVYSGGVLPQAPFRLMGAVYYNLSQSTELIVPGPDLLRPGESHTFTFTLIAGDQNPKVDMAYGGRAIAYNKHTDPNAQDWGNYSKWSTMSFALGTQSVIGPAGPIDTGGALVQLGPTLRAWGEVLGFAASFLLIPAVVLGGVFGRGSITGLNAAFGGARRRVLFHNSTSYGLLGFSVVHMVVLLLEPIWPWSHGLVLGGLALGCMIGLAVTGAFQRRLVVAWGFPRWRFVHFALGVLVVFFVAAHLVIDGSHFEWARALFGETNSGGTG